MSKTIYEVDLREKDSLISTLEISALDGEREIDVPYRTAPMNIKSFFAQATEQEDIMRAEKPFDIFEAMVEYLSDLTEYGEDDGEDDGDTKYVEGTFLAGGKYFEVSMRYVEDLDFGSFGRAAIVDAMAAIVAEAISETDAEGIKKFTSWQDSILKELAEH